MQLEGQVIDIIYKNDINSYTVATFETSEQEETTIVGYLPFVNEGDNLKITGDIVSIQIMENSLKLLHLKRLCQQHQKHWKNIFQMEVLKE